MSFSLVNAWRFIWEVRDSGDCSKNHVDQLIAKKTNTDRVVLSFQLFKKLVGIYK